MPGYSDYFWFHVIVAISLIVGSVCFRPGNAHIADKIMLAFCVIYFAFRSFYEMIVSIECPIESVPIRIDLLILGPVDIILICVGAASLMLLRLRE